MIWGTTWAAIRICLRGFPPLTGAALRFSIAGVALLLIAPFFGVKLGGGWRTWRVWIINTVLTFCISYSILYWAEQWVPSGLASVLFATFPLFVAILAHFVLPNERLTALGLLGVLIGFAGVAVAFASVVVLISPICSAFGSVAVKKWGQGIHPLSTAAVPMALTGLLVAPVAWASERHLGIHPTTPG